ncbi:MAG: PilZ domain-containing protein [Proteobacteria bacterium]|nr:PilZ domain-containing protein [Pseudomonadota bacterium]MBU1736678.1 PilZ domain-containing protein [Pseudomonadota bacterium]
MSGSEHNWDDIPSLKLEMDDEYDQRLQGKDRRRHARVDINSLKGVLTWNINSIPIRIATAGHGVFDATVVDLSQSGVRVFSPKKLNTGERVRVGFKINDRTIIAMAVSIWTRQNETHCTAGLEFQGLSASDSEFLGALATASMFNKTGAFRI